MKATQDIEKRELINIQHTLFLFLCGLELNEIEYKQLAEFTNFSSYDLREIQKRINKK